MEVKAPVSTSRRPGSGDSLMLASMILAIGAVGWMGYSMEQHRAQTQPVAAQPAVPPAPALEGTLVHAPARVCPPAPGARRAAGRCRRAG